MLIAGRFSFLRLLALWWSTHGGISDIEIRLVKVSGIDPPSGSGGLESSCWSSSVVGVWRPASFCHCDFGRSPEAPFRDVSKLSSYAT